MDHIGIDLGATNSHIVVLSASGGRKTRRKLKTAELPRWLAQQPTSHVVMEACTQSPAIARAAISAKHSTKIVPAHLVRLLGVGARGIKTDDRDAAAIANASLQNSELPQVHLRSDQSVNRRELLATRATLLKARAAISTSVKCWLRGRLVTLRGRASSKVFSNAVRTVSLEQCDGLPSSIELMLQTFDHLTDQIERIDEEISTITQQDVVCQRLMSVPGVGPQIALAFTTHVDDPLRFGSADHLASYLALVPGESSTGGKTVRTRTIKAGPSYLKALLVQGAWSMWRARPRDPAVQWARAIADKRGKRIAIVALARKLATVMWSMWKHGTLYEPTRAAKLASADERSPTLAT
jgi:transposase